MAALHGGRILELVVALSQRPEGSRLSEVASVLQVPLSSAQRAVGRLIEEGLVRTLPGRRHAIASEHPAGAALVEFALRKLPLREALDLVCRASPAVEFAARNEAGYLVVLSPFAEPADAARLHDAFERIGRGRRERVAIEVLERSDLRRRLLDDPELRDRGLGMAAVKGAAMRAFRDPHRRGSFEARRLGRLHPSLPRVSRRAVGQLARRYALERVSAFGSAVRADFRPESDVDVLIKPGPQARLGVGDLMSIQEELETMFGREVDVVKAEAMNDRARDRARQEEVVLHGRA